MREDLRAKHYDAAYLAGWAVAARLVREDFASRGVAGPPPPAPRAAPGQLATKVRAGGHHLPFHRAGDSRRPPDRLAAPKRRRSRPCSPRVMTRDDDDDAKRRGSWSSFDSGSSGGSDSGSSSSDGGSFGDGGGFSGGGSSDTI